MACILPCVISYFIISRIVKSGFGKVLEAVRDDELAARVLGKNSFKIKFIALGASAFLQALQEAYMHIT